MKRLIFLGLMLASCRAAAPPPPVPAPDPEAPKREAVEILDSLERTFYSHWGSVESTPEYRRLRAEHVPVLRQIADANGDHSLMALRVLAKQAPAERFSPAARAILYWTAFQREVYFNRWGLISKGGLTPAIYGNELLGLGPAAAPYLQKSLRDRRPAPVFGTEEEKTYRAMGIRVCDYAWVFLATIYDRPVVYDVDPALRDSQIHDLDLWLDRRRR